MLIGLSFSLVLASLYLLFTKKTGESLFLFGMCVSLLLHLTGIMIFIAKKGGIPDEVMTFLFFSKEIRHKARYLYITLNQLGYLIAIGKILYPLFLLKFSLCYSMVEFVKKNRFLTLAVYFFPILHLILYEPHLYRQITYHNTAVAKFILQSGNFWINLYLFFGIALFSYEYSSIKRKFLKKQIRGILICMLTLTGIYFLYYTQDPGQVYRFYDYTFSWGRTIGYLQFAPSLFSYWGISIVSISCCIIGFYSILNFTTGNYIRNKENLVLQRKFDTARVGASMFVHGMKNQLLAAKVIFKRIHSMYEEGEPDSTKLKKQIDTLEAVTLSMYERIEVLGNSIKQKAIFLSPVSVREIVMLSIERFHKKYPDVRVHTEFVVESTVLVDKNQFCEAIENLLLNGYEGILFADRGEKMELSVICHNERLYTVIEIRDNGIGISEKNLKKIFFPFYSSKNSKTNWGMGLYYVKETVKSHYGLLRVESKVGKGTSFYILLPRYGSSQGK